MNFKRDSTLTSQPVSHGVSVCKLIQLVVDHFRALHEIMNVNPRFADWLANLQLPDQQHSRKNSNPAAC